MFILTRVKRDAYECVYTTLLCHHVLCPQTHTHTQDTAIDPIVCQKTHRLQVDGSFPCVCMGGQIFLGRGWSPVVSERHRVFLPLMTLLLTCNNEAQAAELRPPRARCGQGCRLSLILSLSPSIVASFPVLPRGTRPAAGAPHGPKPQRSIQAQPQAPGLTSLCGPWCTSISLRDVTAERTETHTRTHTLASSVNM